jgi:hypothetical protein
MRYFKAFTVNTKPLITWHLWAASTTSFNSLSQADKDLCLAEDQIPSNAYNVCPLKIVSGQLVERTTQEMSDFQSEYNESMTERELKELRKKMSDIIAENGLRDFLGESKSSANSELDALKTQYENLINPA